jgi:hypothetical protein
VAGRRKPEAGLRTSDLKPPAFDFDLAGGTVLADGETLPSFATVKLLNSLTLKLRQPAFTAPYSPFPLSGLIRPNPGRKNKRRLTVQTGHLLPGTREFNACKLLSINCGCTRCTGVAVGGGIAESRWNAGFIPLQRHQRECLRVNSKPDSVRTLKRRERRAPQVARPMSVSGDILLQQDPVVGVARRGLLLIQPIAIDLKDDFVGGVAQGKRNVLHVRAAQEIHDAVVEDVLLVQIAGGEDGVIGVGLVIFGEVFLHVVVKVIRLGAPHFVLGRHERLVDGAKQHGRQDANDADDEQHFEQGERGGRAVVLFHTGWTVHAAGRHAGHKGKAEGRRQKEECRMKKCRRDVSPRLRRAGRRSQA